ncbi:acyloxyacyl hydrolase [Psychrobium sp. MM17-31]|uniref:acyloxyacyl hydrolase n=1 Tax=Psychrobium sp. MM17-31 TaxID=2917758 RepID=UPI001EF5A40B|nr:acyloxyacyl hydrolase [Psychrobium sp. MM17-31]MCG7533151.1 acyloxyacyl hydrolase [Psychrobium sp. MM17-31]
MKLFIKIVCFAVLYLMTHSSSATSINNGYETVDDWPNFPGLKSTSFLSLTNQDVFIGVASAAALSYYLSEYVFEDEQDITFYNFRSGFSQGSGKRIYLNNFGIEKKLSSWFSAGIELNSQYWKDYQTAASGNREGIGGGALAVLRWYPYHFGKASLYAEYTTGLFYSDKRFPFDGTKFTFNHSSHIGIEYHINAKQKLRFGYGNFHQSNNNWIDPNPGSNSNGFAISYSWQSE